MIRKPELSTSVYCSCAELTVVKDIAARDALKVKDKQRVLVLDAAGDKIKGHAEYIYYKYSYLLKELRLFFFMRLSITMKEKECGKWYYENRAEKCKKSISKVLS